jgi:hypothetical protein
LTTTTGSPRSNRSGCTALFLSLHFATGFDSVRNGPDALLDSGSLRRGGPQGKVNLAAEPRQAQDRILHTP